MFLLFFLSLAKVKRDYTFAETNALCDEMCLCRPEMDK